MAGFEYFYPSPEFMSQPQLQLWTLFFSLNYARWGTMICVLPLSRGSYWHNFSIVLLLPNWANVSCSCKGSLKGAWQGQPNMVTLWTFLNLRQRRGSISAPQTATLKPNALQAVRRALLANCHQVGVNQMFWYVLSFVRRQSIQQTTPSAVDTGIYA